MVNLSKPRPKLGQKLMFHLIIRIADGGVEMTLPWSIACGLHTEEFA